MNFLKKLIKSILRNRFGIDVRRYSAVSSPTVQIVSSLRAFDIDMVLDVGANDGGFASEIRDAGYQSEIVSFEPLSSAYELLIMASNADAKWRVHPRCALGDKLAEVEINIAGNSASSSLLPMLNSHLEAAPHTAYVGKETVPLVTLDSISEIYIRQAKNIFLKIDTQGFEWEVLDGASNVLPKVRGVLLELTLTPLYEGQRLWREMVERLEREGFVLWALQQEFIEPICGRTLQVNGVFYRIG